MRKYILPILFVLMFVPFHVKAETCDTNNISISSIKMIEKSRDVEELEEASVNGKKINLNLSMSNVGDNIEYTLLIKNDSNEDYELDKTSINLNSDYINYSFETDDDSNIVKANTSKNVTLRIEYKTEIPENKYKNGSYDDSKNMTVNLSNKDPINVLETIINPNTSVQSYILIILIMLLISGSLCIIMKKKKHVKHMILIITSAIIIPISVYAICKCEINIESHVKIDYLNSYFCEYNVGYMKYRKGMTWMEYVDYIIPNYQNYKLYDLKEDNTYEEIGYLKKYGMNENRIVIRDNESQYSQFNPLYVYAEHIVPVKNNETPREILFDHFFAYGKSKREGENYNYSFPNQFNPIENLDTLYPDFYNEVSVNERWTSWNNTIFDAKYGCYYYDGG